MRSAGLGRDRGRHGSLPGVRVAGKTLGGVTCIRLDASVATCHSDKEGAGGEPGVCTPTCAFGSGLTPLTPASPVVRC
jgi:hypothetical protein